MNFIAGSLYLTFRNAEIVFWAFVNILQKVKCLFSEGVPLLNLSLDIFEKLLHAQLPLVSAHLVCFFDLIFLFIYLVIYLFIYNIIYFLTFIYLFTLFIYLFIYLFSFLIKLIY